MKLFKNEVGRPSNEVIRKRNIVKLSITAGVIALVAIIVGGATLLLSESNTNNLKGAAAKFTVYYHSNGGSGSMSLQRITYGTSTRLSRNTFTKSGYKFVGWKAERVVNSQFLYRGCTTSGTCSNSKAKWLTKSQIKSYFIYKDQEIVSKTAPAGETLYLYAQWEKVSNTVKKTTTKKAVVKTTKKTTTKKVAVKTTKKTTKKTTNKVTKKTTNKGKCILSYDLNGLPVKSKLKDQSSSYGKSITLKNPILKSDNYKFLGWVVHGVGTGTHYNTQIKSSNEYVDFEFKLLKNTSIKIADVDCEEKGVVAEASYVGIKVKNITNSSATIHFVSEGYPSYYYAAPILKSYTVYKSDKNGKVGSRVEQERLKESGTNVIPTVAGLKANTYYLASVKFEDFNGKEGVVVNKLFKTSGNAKTTKKKVVKTTKKKKSIKKVWDSIFKKESAIDKVIAPY